MTRKGFGVKYITCIFICLNVIIEGKHRHYKKEFGPKIVGGKPAALENFPHSVQFFNYGALCGGVILNSWAILTSAHCLDSNKKIEEMRIQIGSKYIYDFKAQKYEVDYYVIHSNYSRVIPFEHDIALIFVKGPIKFGKLAKKGILINNNKWMNPKEKKFVATGWGWQKYGGALSEMSLMMTYLRFVPLNKCSQMHKITMSEDMFCLYGDGKRDTCRGDSGGGVLWKGRIVGLTSHGDGCAKKGKPSVYTNVWYMKSWIKKQMNKFASNYCKNKLIFNRTIIDDDK